MSPNHCLMFVLAAAVGGYVLGWWLGRQADGTKRPTRAVVTVASHGFTLGQIVQHKIDAVRVVIIQFFDDAEGPKALCAFSSNCGAEATFSVYELTAVGPTPPDVAVDPHVEDSGPASTRAT
jgi:hypothetical protein